MRWRPVRAAVVVVVGLVVAVVPAGSAPAADEEGRGRVFRLLSPEITESSSLLVSSRDPSLVYTTNDSGDGPVVYAVDTGTGRLVGRTTLSGVEAVDIEALAGAADALVVADIGDNDAERATVMAYRMPQPLEGDRVRAAEAVSLRYAGGPRDAEAALYDAATERLYVVSKEISGAAVYRSPPRVFDRDRAVLERVASAPALATDATLLPKGDVAVIRTYVSATVYRFPSFEQVTRVRLPVLGQGESVTAPRDGRVIWVGTEGPASPVVEVRLPKVSAAPQSTPPTKTAPTTTPGESTASVPRPSEDVPGESSPSVEDSRRGLARTVLLGATAGLVAIAVVWLLLALRHRGRR